MWNRSRSGPESIPLRVVAPMIVNFLSGRLIVRRHALAEHDVNAEVFHDWVDEFLDGLGQAVDLINEEDGALRRVGEVRHDIHLLVESRAAGHVQLDSQLIVQHGRESRLAQPGRAVEEDMGQGLAPLRAAISAMAEALGHGPLADDLVQPLRTKLFIDRIDHPRRRAG